MVLVGAGCDRLLTVTATQLTGSFELVRADGAPLPFDVWREDSLTGVLHAERFEFRADGRATRTYRFVITDAVSGDEEVIERELDVRYRRNGRSIEIGWFEPCPPNALCIPNDTGRIRGDRLELDVALWRADRLRAIYLRR